MKRELKIFAALAGIFLVAYFLPLGNTKVQDAIQESFRLLQWYARNHTLACIVPALFIAGAIITFLSQSSVMRYLGPKANPILAYGVASVSGCVLAVCSCSVLPKPGAHHGATLWNAYNDDVTEDEFGIESAKELGIEYQLEKVTQINEIMKMGVMITPALAVDGQVKIAGKVASSDDIKKMLTREQE